MIIPTLLAAALALSAEPRDIEPPCAVFVHFTLNSYTGPVVIEDVCLTSYEYTENVMTITAVDYGNRIFRGDFEVWP